MARPTIDLDNPDARRQLLDQFAAWSADQLGDDDGTRRSDAESFVEWFANYTDDELGDLQADALAEYLLRWCPARLSAPASIAPRLCESLESFVEYLHSAGLLEGGAGRAAQLIAYVSGIVGDVEDAMGDESKFGMAKSMLFGDNPLDPNLSLDQLQVELEARMAAHNARPIEERRAATDRFFAPKLYDLGFSYLPPATREVESSASESPLLGQVEGLRGYLGEAGRVLTKNGNLKLADARELIALLDTGDRMDSETGGRVWKTTSSENLPKLNGIVELALTAGAVRRNRGRLVPVKRWAKLSATARLEQLWAALMDLDMLFLPRYNYGRMIDHHQLLVDGIPHGLLRLLPDGMSVRFDGLVEMGCQATQVAFADEEPEWLDHLVESTEDRLSRIFETVERAGVVRWTGWRTRSAKYFAEITYRHGGDIELTAIGRHLVAPMAQDYGYTFHQVRDLADLDAAELVDVLADNNLDTDYVLEQWRPGESARKRGELIAEMLLGDTDATRRLIAFRLLDQLPVHDIAGSLRQLLDTPSAGHAALLLLGAGLATEEEVGDFVGVGPFVDILASVAEDPELVTASWSQVLASGSDPYALLDELWRHSAPETAIVLETLGKVLPDRGQAKAARKALVRHRSRMANR